MNVYVYALVEAAPGRIRIAGHTLELLPVGGLYAAVERLPSAPTPSESTLRVQHDLVVRLSRRVNAILPSRFGAYLDVAELQRIVARRQKVLLKALERVRDADQMTIRIFREDPIGSLTQHRREPRTGTEYLLGRRPAARQSTEARVLRGAVQKLALAERTDVGSSNLIVLHHLVARGSERRYLVRVNRAAATLPLSVHVTVSGPWPPFAFAPDLLE